MEFHSPTPKDYHSDDESFGLVCTKPGFSPIIPDFHAVYTQANAKASWIQNIGRNMKYHLQSYWKSSLKEFFLMSSDSVYLLGICYDCDPPLKPTYKQLKKELSSIIWVTYRSNFRMLTNYSTSQTYFSDSGWGCTIRAGQMLLLNSLKRHYNLNKRESYEIIKTIEENLECAHYSLHNLLKYANLEKNPGDWFSPSLICHSITKIFEIFPLANFKPVVFMDSFIYKDQLFSLACDKPLDFIKNFCLCECKKGFCEFCNKKPWVKSWENGVLMMMPLMLGRKRIQKDYYETFKFLLRNPYCVGIVGGKPSSALYLVGYKNDSIIVFDPHYVQPASKNLSHFKKQFRSYFNKNLNTVNIQELESSMSVGFYFRDNKEFAHFCRILKENRNVLKDVIVVKDLTPDYILNPDVFMEENEDGFIVL